MNNNSKDKKNKEFNISEIRNYLPVLLPLSGIVVLIFLSFKILLPETLKIKEEYESLDSKKEEQAVLEKKLDILNSYQKNELTDIIFRTSVVVPANKQLGELLILLTKIEEESGAAVSDFSLSKNKEAKKGLRLELSISGSNEQITDFLKSVDRQDRLLLLEDAAFSFEESLINLNLTIFAPFLPYIEEIGSTEDTLPEISEKEKELMGRLPLLEELHTIGEEERKDYPAREDPFAL